MYNKLINFKKNWVAENIYESTGILINLLINWPTDWLTEMMA